MKSPITFVCLIVTLLMSGLSYGQQTVVSRNNGFVVDGQQTSCSNGRCYNSPGVVQGVVRNTVYGTATVVGSVVQATGTVVSNTVRTTGAVVERVVDTTGEVLTRTVDAAGNVVYTTARVATAPVRGLAQAKAERQAAMQRCCHVGGGFGGARYEGVGFSTVSEEDAIKQCCYSNRPIRESGVAYGYNRQLGVWGHFSAILCD